MKIYNSIFFISILCASLVSLKAAADENCPNGGKFDSTDHTCTTEALQKPKCNAGFYWSNNKEGCAQCSAGHKYNFGTYKCE